MAESVSFGPMSYTCIFGWKIRNLLKVDNLQSEPLRYDESDWKLEIRKTAEPFELNAICISLEKMNKKLTSHKFKVITYIEDRFKKQEFLQETNINTSDCSQTEIWKLYSDKFQQHKNVESDSVVKFVLMFTSMEYGQKGVDKESKLTQTPPYLDLEPSLESLSLDFRKLLDKGESNLQLKSPSSDIRAHPLILKARSEEFAEQLSNDKITQIKVDIDSSVLKQFVNYIYTGKLSNLSEDNVQPLYEAASTYAISSLRDLCSNYMTEHLTNYNACDFLVLADKHQDKGLKENVLSYIVDTDLPLKDTEWEVFCSEHNKLSNEVLYQAYVAKCSSDRISELLLKFPQK